MKVKKFLLAVGLLGVMFNACADGVKISSYPRAASLGDNDLFIVAYYSGAYTTNKSIAFTNLTTQLIGIVNNNIKFGSLTGMLKVTGGTPGTATPGIDYQNPFSTGPGVTNISQVVSAMITNNDATITTTTNSGGVIGIGTVGLATQANLTTVSNTVNGKQAAFTTGLGITNVANVLSNNIVAGANVTITAGSSGQLSIASSGGGGGGGIAGTVINSGASTANAIPTYSNTTGTNVTPSLVTITGNTNLNAAALTIGTGGTPFTIIYANGGNITNGGNSVTVTNDIAQKFNAAVTIGSSSGIPKLTSGLVGLATAGSGGDYSSPAANEFGGFTSKASPIAADVFMLEDSAASGAKKKATIGTIPIAASQVNSGVLAIGRLATGTPDGTKFVRDDGTLAVPAGGGGGTAVGTYIRFGGTDSSFNPANGGFTYYSGDTVFSLPSTTYTNQCIPVFKTGTIKAIGIRMRVDGTLASSENVTFKISINGAAGTGTGVTMPLTAINNFSTSTSESIAVTAGQTIAITFTTPNTWATPPTTCYFGGWAYEE